MYILIILGIIVLPIIALGSFILAFNAIIYGDWSSGLFLAAVSLSTFGILYYIGHGKWPTVMTAVGSVGKTTLLCFLGLIVVIPMGLIMGLVIDPLIEKMPALFWPVAAVFWIVAAALVWWSYSKITKMFKKNEKKNG